MATTPTPAHMPQPQPQRTPTPTIDSQKSMNPTPRAPPPTPTLAPHTPPPATSPVALGERRAAYTPRSSACSSTPEQAPSCSAHPAALGARWRHAGPGDLSGNVGFTALHYTLSTRHGRSRRPGTRRVAPYRERRPWGLLGARVCTRGSPLQTPHICSIVHLHARAPYTVAFARALCEPRLSCAHARLAECAPSVTTHPPTHTHRFSATPTRWTSSCVTVRGSRATPTYPGRRWRLSAHGGGASRAGRNRTHAARGQRQHRAGRHSPAHSRAPHGALLRADADLARCGQGGRAPLSVWRRPPSALCTGGAILSLL